MRISSLNGLGSPLVRPWQRQAAVFKLGPGDAVIVARCAAEGLLLISAGTHMFRLVPPLTISNADVEATLGIIEKVLG